MGLSISEALQKGFQLHQSGRFAEAESIYRQILQVEPNHADSLHLLGLLAQQHGQHSAACELLARAVNAKPNDAELLASLGASLGMCGRLDDVVAALTRALQIQPNLADVRTNLGFAYLNRGKTLTSEGRFAEAIDDFRHATALQPNSADAQYNLGVALERNHQRDEAIPHYREATRLDPTFAEAHFNLGACFLSGLHLPQALQSFREAAWRKPQLVVASDMLLHFQHHLPETDPNELFHQHLRWATQFAEPLAKEIQPHTNSRDPNKRLRIGYVSPDFRRHSVSYFLEPLLAAHAPREVEFVCYADELQRDATTQRLQQSAAGWRNISNVSDADVAKMVRADGIDILVDLAGHTLHNRLCAFARKPAPVQVTYLGYPDTTGVSTIDYRLTDALADPPGLTESIHSEQLIRIPDCAWCYRPDEHTPEIQPLADRETITFGCFNVASKINAPLIVMWSQILKRLPASRLILKTGQPQDSQSHTAIIREFVKNDIEKDRLEFVGFFQDVAEHLRFILRVDIALDTFPYHGTTTTCETLWMGVPVIVLAGKTHVSRVGVSLLAACGLADLVAATPEEYITLALKLASDISRIAELRRTLRDRMRASPLMDSNAFARKFERIYREIWQTWCTAK